MPSYSSAKFSVSSIEIKNFKEDYKKVSKMSTKEKIDYFSQLIQEIKNAPKEKTTSIDIDGTNYIINKKGYYYILERKPFYTLYSIS